jgi:hypothetical protein
LPPDYLLYESYGMRYAAYADGGKQAAEWLFGMVSPWLESFEADKRKPLSVLDWGCGPARMIRHLPDLLPPGSRVCRLVSKKSTRHRVQPQRGGGRTALCRCTIRLGVRDIDFYAPQRSATPRLV